jgi:TatD DNase family protein
MLKEQVTEKCVAVGECGLDFYHGRDNEVFQKQILETQIKLANQCGLPVLLHCRKAHQDLVVLLKHTPPKFGGVVHGFSGSWQQAMDFVKMGLKIGVGGVITYQRAKKTRATMAALPLESLLIETDAPDMPLSGYQGEPNEPRMISLVLSSLIELRNESEQTVASQLNVNSKCTFNFCD